MEKASKTWIDQWNPDDATFWEKTGKKVAWRNLGWSILAENIGFSIWLIWSVVAARLKTVGFHYTTDQLFQLVAIPGLVGALMRFPYTFAVPKFGGRNWTIVSALLLFIPTLSLIYFVNRPETPFWLMATAAATAGLGGGNFSSSMANISFFFPDKEKGFALGLNAAGGNIGVSTVQLLVPIVVGYGLLPGSAGKKLFPLLLKTQFPQVTSNLAFLGALVGSVSRPIGGKLADRLGGAKVTFWNFVVMTAATFGLLYSLQVKDFALFMTAFLGLFITTGIGNGSTFRMIPVIFRAHHAKRVQGQGESALAEAMIVARRETAAVIGVVAGIGALGGYFIPRAFGASNNATGGATLAVSWFIAFYLTCVGTTWWCYLRRSFLTRRMPSLASAQA